MIVVRALTLLTLALGLLARPDLTRASSRWPVERHLILAASHRLQHEVPAAVAVWLRVQPEVSSAAVGRDGGTVTVHFRDGVNAAVLPATAPASSAAPFLTRREMVRRQSASGHPRALVLEPFASELNLGPQAGQVEADDLQAAGYRVDRLVDGAVTMAIMSTLANYNVVYILTHSGVNQWGEGVVATGQLANTDPSIDPLIKEFSVLVVGVVGTNQLYYGIMSRYIQYHVGRFPAHSLMFINGCSMLGASLFWKALASKGVGAMVSWDHDALATDDVPAGTDFLGAMYQGKDVADAVAAVRADGQGTSQPADGPIANFGYLGDGTITLQSASGVTPTPTSAPSTATPAARKPAPRVSLLEWVSPGRSQRVSVVSAPGAPLRITVVYPDGDRHAVFRVGGARGRLTYAYTQPPSVITPWQVHARVIVTDRGSHASVSAGYTIDPGLFDLHLGRPSATPGAHVAFWVYSERGGQGRIAIQLHGRVLQRIPVRLVARRWVRVPYTVSGASARGPLIVRAYFFGIGSTMKTLIVR